MTKKDGDTSKATTIGAALSPFLIHPILTLAARRGELVWPFLTRPAVQSATDIALPIVSSLIGFYLLTRVVRRSVVVVGLAYVPIVVAALLYVSLMVFGYAWRDYP